jgi:peptidoglycan/xylan/chitin deacetylase (PgdA/CDA1 family)
MLRGLIKNALAVALDAVGIEKFGGQVLGSKTSPLILGYHQVVPEFRSDWRFGITSNQISAAMLEKHLDWLGRRFEFVSLDEVGAHFESGEPFAKPAVAITFDDGYRDVYRNAFPILKHRGIPGAVFVVTDIVGTETPPLHDRLYSVLAMAFERWARPDQMILERLVRLNVAPEAVRKVQDKGRDVFSTMRVTFDALKRSEREALVASLEADLSVYSHSLEEALPLTWEMVKEMSEAGITIGSHTRSHALLTAEQNDRVVEELHGSKAVLQRRLGMAPRHFAYPDGRFNVKTAQAVASAYPFGYTTCRHQLSEYPLVTIPRRVFWEKTCTDSLGRFSGAVMNCQAHGVFDWTSRCGQMHGGVVEDESASLHVSDGASRPPDMGLGHGGVDA